jgi:hypothetical protein
LTGDTGEQAAQVGPEQGDRTDDRHSDQPGDEAVFDRGGSIAIIGE